jgi:hypothetical protein
MRGLLDAMSSDYLDQPRRAIPEAIAAFTTALQRERKPCRRRRLAEIAGLQRELAARKAE